MTFGIRSMAVAAVCVMTAWTAPLPLAAQELPQAEVERMVREYLLREPEVVFEALQEFQRRQEVAEVERQKQLLVSHAPMMFEDERDPVSNSDGDVVLVEFFDYRCGYCRRMVDGVEMLTANDENLRFVFKEFPILGEDSTRAAKAALAAKEQGHYDEMHFALMRARDLSFEGIFKIAQDIGMDIDRLAEDMESEAVAAHLSDNIQLARTLGINGTPSFVFADELIPGAVPIEQLEAMIEQRRADG